MYGNVSHNAHQLNINLMYLFDIDWQKWIKKISHTCSNFSLMRSSIDHWLHVSNKQQNCSRPKKARARNSMCAHSNQKSDKNYFFFISKFPYNQPCCHTHIINSFDTLNIYIHIQHSKYIEIENVKIHLLAKTKFEKKKYIRNTFFSCILHSHQMTKWRCNLWWATNEKKKRSDERANRFFDSFEMGALNMRNIVECFVEFLCNELLWIGWDALLHLYVYIYLVDLPSTSNMRQNRKERKKEKTIAANCKNDDGDPVYESKRVKPIEIKKNAIKTHSFNYFTDAVCAYVKITCRIRNADRCCSDK